jgi:hypothetical protein
LKGKRQLAPAGSDHLSGTADLEQSFEGFIQLLRIMNFKKGGRSVERRKALTSLGVGVELEWEAGRGNPTPHGLG